MYFLILCVCVCVRGVCEDKLKSSYDVISTVDD